MDKASSCEHISRWSSSINKYLEKIGSRKLIIYGEDIYTIAVCKTSLFLEYDVECVLSESLDSFEVNVYSISELQKYVSEKYFVLVATLTEHKEAYEHLISCGYQLNEDFAIMGIGGYTNAIDAIDSLLGFSRSNDDILGFKVCNGKTSDTFKIVVLGNSTSDPSTGMLKSWPDFLSEIAEQRGIDVTIYNGAVTGYCSTQEFLKLNRDVLELKPDLILSFSGYNDIEGTSSVEKSPFLHKYSRKFYDFLKTNSKLAPDSMYMRNVNIISHGGMTEEPDYMIWVYNMRKMYAICNVYNISFIAYLQPMLECESVKIDLVLNDIINEFYMLTGTSRDYVSKITKEYLFNVEKNIQNDIFIKNLKGLFKKKKNVFYDICHYTEKGNRIIAERVFADIEKYVLYRGVEND